MLGAIQAPSGYGKLELGDEYLTEYDNKKEAEQACDQCSISVGKKLASIKCDFRASERSFSMNGC